MREIAIVTGGNSGIGYEVVRALAQGGMTVYLGARDQAKGEAAAAELAGEGDIRPVVLDMTVPTGFAPVLDAIERDHGRLDVLVNNAGLSLGGSVAEVDAETIRTSFETNLHGPARLIQLAIPLLKRSANARVVNVSSGAGQIAALSGSRFAPATILPYAYCVSKAALNAATIMQAAALRDEGIRVNACNPGYVKTQVSRFRGTRTPAEGARIIIELATSDRDGPSGGFFDDKGPLDW